ncbi:MAG: DUF86 domain-containing protein [Promethearchaeia archaeon]
MDIDENLIQGKFDIIERNLKFLNEFKSLTDKEFTKSYKDVQAAKYSLLEIIESCIDIAAHLISVSNLERPKTYAEMFKLLGENEIINLSLSQNLSNMARFRNLLVHSYGKIDNSKVLKYIKNDLDKITEYIKNILNLI